MIEIDARHVPYEVADLDTGTLLGLVAEDRVRELKGVRRKLRLAYHLAVTHPPTPQHPAAVMGDLAFVANDCEDPLAGEGTPEVALFAVEDYSAAAGLSRPAALSLVADALDLHHRLPKLWRRVEALEVEGWRARRIALLTRKLSYEAARWFDTQLAEGGRTGWPTVEKHLAAAIARFHPDVVKDPQAPVGKEAWGVVLRHPNRGREEGALGVGGTSELTAVGDSLDLARFYDLLTAEADQMRREGDCDTLEQRRAKAIGRLADDTLGPGSGGSTQPGLDLTGATGTAHAGLEVVHHPQPELGSFGVLDPDPQDLLLAVDADTDRQVGGLVLDRALVADLAHDGVEEDHRPHRIQRARLPLADLVEDGIGDLGDQVWGDVDLVDVEQVGLDVAHGHAVGVEADHDLVDPIQAALALAHDLGLVGAVAVPRHVQIERACLGDQLLRGVAVAAVSRPVPGRVADLVAEVIGQLFGQRPLEHGLGHLLEQAALAEQLHALLTGLLDERLGLLGIEELWLLRRASGSSHLDSVQHFFHGVSSISNRSRGSGWRSRPYTDGPTRPRTTVPPAHRVTRTRTPTLVLVLVPGGDLPLPVCAAPARPPAATTTRPSVQGSGGVCG